MRYSILILAALFISHCGGSSGGNAPNVEGTYDQTGGSALCVQNLDDTIVVIQDGNDIIVQATTPGFSDALGSVDDDGDFTINGSFGDGTPFECNGTFIGDVASAQCEGAGLTCNITYERR